MAKHWQLPPGLKRALAAMLLAWAVLVAALLSQGCAPAPDEPPVITMACVRSFATTLAEWERFAAERVPEQCRFLDADYDVQVVDELPPQCGTAPPGMVVAECTLPRSKVIYILSALDDVARVDLSVHEWIHALSACVYGDPDQTHARSGLWGDSRPDPVELRAQAAAVLGECL